MAKGEAEGACLLLYKRMLRTLTDTLSENNFLRVTVMIVDIDTLSELRRYGLESCWLS